MPDSVGFGDVSVIASNSKPWLESTRDDRLTTFPALPDLIKALSSEADLLLTRVEEAAKAAESMMADIQEPQDTHEPKLVAHKRTVPGILDHFPEISGAVRSIAEATEKIQRQQREAAESLRVGLDAPARLAKAIADEQPKVPSFPAMPKI